MPPKVASPWLGLHRHRALLVGTADDRGLLAVTGDDAHPLVELGDDVLGCGGFEKRDAIFAAGGKDALARLPHLRRVGVTRHRPITERQAQIAWAHLGKAEARHGEDLLAMGDTFGALDLD